MERMPGNSSDQVAGFHRPSLVDERLPSRARVLYAWLLPRSNDPPRRRSSLKRGSLVREGPPIQARRMPVRASITVLVAVVLSAFASASGAAPTASTSAVRDPNVAALQVGLRARGVYSGPVDGLAGPGTVAAVRALGGNGLFGARTRARLGQLGRHPLGSRPVGGGAVGWDAAALQFMLAWHGFPSATVDGAFGSHSVRALGNFERWAGLPADGVAGPAVIAALQQPPPTCPIALRP